ncbi:transcription antitermination factor NusB [Treponema primitia ZAS-2]|uniref:Transcription antitermination protein NusB n=1 Tax=Treponema primitia (strain ATCC BAA-887 / DSM 12427 / ZAS-2) TaxID=545694 RepID=F5YJB4_TREPZ|nr:transcription antitermination factor NusB [Treponema primitia]AEF83938.1 transcription antitermination factor NusB [Treponema primitia ZAS-2]
MASRRKGRILAFQALYSWEAAEGVVGKSPAAGSGPFIPEGLLNFSWLETEKLATLDGGTAEFSRLLIQGTIENIAAVDAMIRSHLKNWDFSRLNRVDLAILRMSSYTLMFQGDVSPSIVIDEAIGISKEFGTDDSYRFINGVLDSIRRTLQESENQKQQTLQDRQIPK